MVTLRRPWLVGLLVLALLGYAAMWLGWATPWTWLVAGDEAALAATHRFGWQHPDWITLWNVSCNVLSPVMIRIVTLGVIGWALMRGQRRAALFLFVSVELSALLTELAKALANRPRPVTAMVAAHSTSFPSGHALGTMVAVLALLTIGLPLVSPPARRWLIGAGVAVVVLVGVGRVMLNVHNPSDVVAGWALGYAYFAGCYLLLGRRLLTATDEIPVALGSSP
jgi:membrane-associated phospholipid phosphatase